MSSTTNIQNLLVNVFRPIYEYDPNSTTQLFRTKLAISNVDTYIGNSISIFRADIGDSASNVYVGIGSGNDPTIDIKNCRFVTAVGYNSASNISNVSNSVYIGFDAGKNQANSSSNVIIGANNTIVGNNVSSNIFIGCGTGSVGSNNILIGTGLLPGNVNDTIRIAQNITGNILTKWVGIGGVIEPTYPTLNALDISGHTYSSGKIGIQMLPSNSLNVNGETQSTGGFFSLTGGVLLAGNGSCNVAIMRQGTMLLQAQDPDTPSTNYFSRNIYIRDETGVNAPVTIQGVSNGYVTFTYSGSNIVISNTDASPHTFKWSMTSFPLDP